MRGERLGSKKKSSREKRERDHTCAHIWCCCNVCLQNTHSCWFRYIDLSFPFSCDDQTQRALVRYRSLQQKSSDFRCVVRRHYVYIQSIYHFFQYVFVEIYPFFSLSLSLHYVCVCRMCRVSLIHFFFLFWGEFVIREFVRNFPIFEELIKQPVQ